MSNIIGGVNYRVKVHLIITSGVSSSGVSAKVLMGSFDVISPIRGQDLSFKNTIANGSKDMALLLPDHMTRVQVIERQFDPLAAAVLHNEIV
jgi:hypothetical protein